VINEIHIYGPLYCFSHIRAVPVHMKFNGTDSSKNHEMFSLDLDEFKQSLCYVRFEVFTRDCYE
jgi:hypothetical protein